MLGNSCIARILELFQSCIQLLFLALRLVQLYQSLYVLTVACNALERLFLILCCSLDAEMTRP